MGMVLDGAGVADSITTAVDVVPRFRLDVAAANVTDAVRAAGGLLCDRAMAGWDVRVYLASPNECGRALEILGAECFSLERGLTVIQGQAPTSTLVVAVDLFADNPQIRRHAAKAGHRKYRDVLLWGVASQECAIQPLTPVEYRMTSAARAFKTEAMRAIIATGSPETAPRSRFSRATRSASRLNDDLCRDGALRWNEEFHSVDVIARRSKARTD